MTTKISAPMIAGDYRDTNRLHNGAFQINQRGVSGTVVLAANTYGHDRWRSGAAGCTYTFSTVNGLTTITITAGTLYQAVEGVNVANDVMVLSWVGTAQGRIGGGAYGSSGVTGNTTGGSAVNVEFQNGTLTKVQLEVGSVPTPFAFRDYGQELALCQRYYYRVTNFPLGVTLNVSDGYNAIVPFPVTMRAAPTLEAGASYAVGSGSAGTPQLIYGTANAARMNNSAANWTANVTVTLTAGFTAEP